MNGTWEGGTADTEVTWSPRSAWRIVGVPDRVCRRAVDKGLVPKKRLRGEHLLVLRVLAHIEHFPSTAPPAPQLLIERNRLAGKATEECWYQGDDEWLLMVTGLDARLIRDEAMTSVLLRAFQDRPLLLLPIGKWRAELREVAA